jgi:hypothetical protein
MTKSPGATGTQTTCGFNPMQKKTQLDLGTSQFNIFIYIIYRKNPIIEPDNPKKTT